MNCWKGTMKNVEIIRIPITTPTLYPNTTTNCYMISNRQESILIDAGYNISETKEQLERVLFEHQLPIPKGIILTHYHLDHAPGVLQLLHWQAKIYCHPLEEKEILKELKKEIPLTLVEDGDQLTIGDHELMIQHSPGHTKGHINVYLPKEKILFAGDNLVAEGTSWIGPPDGNMSQYFQTLFHMKKLDLVKVGPGHGPWIHNPYEHIDFVINRRQQREKEIVNLLINHPPLSSSELTKMIYKDSIHPTVFEVARRTTIAHLNKLIEEKKVKEISKDIYTMNERTHDPSFI